jgi:hypothetical protein
VKCAAVHVATGVEVSAIGPAADRRAVERLAMTKLRRTLSAR